MSITITKIKTGSIQLWHRGYMGRLGRTLVIGVDIHDADQMQVIDERNVSESVFVCLGERNEERRNARAGNKLKWKLTIDLYLHAHPPVCPACGNETTILMPWSKALLVTFVFAYPFPARGSSLIRREQAEVVTVVGRIVERLEMELGMVSAMSALSGGMRSREE